MTAEAISYQEVDCEVRRLVQLINAFPGLRTTGSCAGHELGRKAEVDIVAESQQAVGALFTAMPFWGRKAGFENNQPQARVIWATVSPDEQGHLAYKLWLSGSPLWVQKVLIGEVEGTLAGALREHHGW